MDLELIFTLILGVGVGAAAYEAWTYRQWIVLTLLVVGWFGQIVAKLLT